LYILFLNKPIFDEIGGGEEIRKNGEGAKPAARAPPGSSGISVREAVVRG
jgi:hypothetical protein